MTAWVRIGASVLALGVVSAPILSPANAAPIPTPVVQLAVEGLERNPPIFSDPRAPGNLNPQQLAELNSTIKNGGTPIYVAVLPDSAGAPAAVTSQIQTGYDRPGTYATVVGNQYDASSSLFVVKDLLALAFKQERANGTAAVLDRFAELVAERANGVAIERKMIDWGSALYLLAFLVAILVVYIAYSLAKRGKPHESNDDPN